MTIDPTVLLITPRRGADPTPFQAARKALASAFLCALLSFAPAEASYLEDFYDAAGAQVASTPAGLYQSASLGLATGGSFSVRVPPKDLPLMQMKAPSLSAGCGGIDIFLGAVSIPSREEFVSFLRGIGTAMPGLAFQVALQALSPDLNEQVSAFRDLIRDYTEKFSDSCTAAQTIFDATGATDALAEAGYRARNALLSSGEASDAGEADQLVRTDGEKRIESVPERTDSNGNVVDAGEVNLTWSLLPGGTSGLETDLRQLMMTLVGTRIYRKVGSGSNATLEAVDLAPKDIALRLVTGPVSGGKRVFDVYRCDETKKCLTPVEDETSDLDLTARVYGLLSGYVRAIASRTETIPNEADLAALAGMTSLPILRIAELAAQPRFQHVGERMLQTYSELVAWEIVIAAVKNLTHEVETAVTGSAARGAAKRNDEHAARILARLAIIREGLAAEEGALLERLTAATNFAQSLEHIERSLYGQSAARMITTLSPDLPR